LVIEISHLRFAMLPAVEFVFGEQSDIPLPSSAGETHTPTTNIKFIHHTFAIASSAAVAAQ
jgi:hypothetical protein